MSLYHQGNRELQDAFDTRRLADRIEEKLARDHLTVDDKAFIERLDLFFMATTDAQGQPSCSYKGGDPGFVRVIGPKEMAFPIYDGNGMFLSTGNVLVHAQVGLLLIDFEQPRRLRIHGVASIHRLDALLTHYPEAQLIVRVHVQTVFPNCPRYVHKYQRVENSVFVPHAGCETPVPNWKRSDWAKDVLPENDSARKVKP